MPFSHVAPAFQPEQLAKLTEAFDRAWPAVSLASPPGDFIQMTWQKKRLANYILACASRGEFDPDKLAEQAFLALIKRVRTAYPAAVECKPGFPQQASADCGSQ